MTALELANWLNDYGSQYAGSTADKAADMLRRQHEAIQRLREALNQVIYHGDTLDAWKAAQQALKDTEGLV